MTKALLLIFALVCALPLFAQGGRYDTWAVDSNNHFVANPTVRVCTYSATPATPCTPLASIYSDKDLAPAHAQSNPFTGDAYGNYGFFAAPACYNVQVSGAGISTATYPVCVGGDVTQAGTSTITGLLNAALAPKYLYANQSTYWRWQLARASSSQIYALGNGTATTPVRVSILGDSISGFSAMANVDAMSQYMPLNALGYGNFYSIHAALFGSAVTYSESGCVDTRDDNTSAQNWGPGGSRIDCSGTWSVSYAPAAQYRFDTFQIFYEQTSGGGSFSYTVDGGAPVTVSTTGAEQLGISTVTIAGASQATTHTIALANVSGAVRLYGISTSQRAQPGFILDFVQSGGSQLAQWVSFPAFTQQLIAALNPGLLAVRLGANDAGTGAIPAATFGTNLSSWLSALSIPSTTATMVLTNTPRGTTTAVPQSSNCTDDAASGALFEGYRAQLFNLAPSLGFSIYDERRYWPGSTATYTTFTTGCAAGMNADQIHPSSTGATYEAYGLAAAIFQGLETPSRDLPVIRNLGFLMTPNAKLSAAAFASNGGISDTGTGLSFPTSQAIDVSQTGTRYWRFGFNENSVNAISCYPTTTNPTCIYGFRRDSAATRAFSVNVNSDASTSIDTNNGDLVLSTAGVAHARALLNSGDAFLGFQADHFGTTANCSSAAGTCSAAPAGSVSIAAAATAVTVATTAVTANSQIFVQEDSSLGTKLGVTCNTTITRDYTVTARVAGTSFTITSSAAPTTNPACLSYTIVN